MRIAAFDIEATDFKADAGAGSTLCAAFAPISGDKARAYVLKKCDYPGKDILDDTALLKAIHNEMHKYHMIVTWYGKGYDIKFLQGRSYIKDLDFKKPQFHLDLYYYAHEFNLTRRSLDNVSRQMGCKTQKTRFNREGWKRAELGDKRSLAAIYKHCEFDVVVLRELYWKMLPLVANIHR